MLKGIFIISTTLLLTLSSFGQAKVHKFRAYLVALEPPQDDIQKNTPTKWDSSNILVVFNYGKDKIHIYAEKEADFDLVRTISKDYYGNGLAKTNMWQAVDQDGEECKVFFEWLPVPFSYQVANLSVIYSSGTLTYKLKRND